MNRFLIRFLAPVALVAGVGGATVLVRRRRARSRVQPAPPMPPGMPQDAPDQQVDPYYGGDRLGISEPTASGISSE